MDAGLAIRDITLDHSDADGAGRPGFVLLVTSAHPECTCPDDCERDHPNE